MCPLCISENKEIKEFYESNLHCLKNCSMDLIHYDIIRNIAVLLDSTKTFDEEWKRYATEMGLDNKTLAVSIVHYQNIFLSILTTYSEFFLCMYFLPCY